MGIPKSGIKAAANKIEILVNTPTFYVLRMNFRGRIFSGVYQPQDTRDEKVSSVLPHWEHGEIEPWIRQESVESVGIPWKFHGKSMRNLWTWDRLLTDPRPTPP